MADELEKCKGLTSDTSAMRRDSRTDDPQPHKRGATTGGEETQYLINVPDVRVTIDSYTPFQAHVISLLKSIDARLKRIHEQLNQKG